MCVNRKEVSLSGSFLNLHMFRLLLPINDLKTGILKDWLDFKQIVVDIVKQNPCATNTPKALDLFYELFNLLNKFSQAASLDGVR